MRLTWVRLLGSGVLLAAAAVGCTKRAVSLDDRPCDTRADCLPDYACNMMRHVCEAVSSSCADGDGDGYGEGAGCIDVDCDDTVAACTVDCASDTDHDGRGDCADGCVDVDRDGFGAGPDCPDADCDDSHVGCTLDCTSADSDTIPDCRDGCLDFDGDGLGNGQVGNAECVVTTTDSDDFDSARCTDTDSDGCDDCSSGDYDPTSDGTDADSDGICTSGDCNDNAPFCTNDCVSNLDADAAPDCLDACVDVDGDGAGRAGYDRSGCANTVLVDANDADASVCGDADGDGCEDCGSGHYDPTSDGTDVDGDGVCNVSDCNDRIPTCTFDCTTNSDTDLGTLVNETPTSLYAAVDCVELFCGTDPTNTDPAVIDHCGIANSDVDLGTLIAEANARPGHQKLLLGSFAVNAVFTAFADGDGATVRQCVGCVLDVASATAALFTLSGNNNVFDGVRITTSGDKDYEGFTITGSTNTLVDVSILNFRSGAVLIAGGSGNVVRDSLLSSARANAAAVTLEWTGAAQPTNTWIIGNLIANNSAAGVLLDDTASGTVDTRIVGNVIAGNTGAGIQAQEAASLFIDQNTLANNTSYGVRFDATSSTNVCLRNNSFSGNATSALRVDIAVTPNLTPDCVGPLSAGPTYGNHVDDDVFCSGSATCPPDTSLVWEFTGAPLYCSTVVTDPTYYCLGDGSATCSTSLGNQLLGAGCDLGYDLGSFASTLVTPTSCTTGVDIGGRQAGLRGCPP